MKKIWIPTHLGDIRLEQAGDKRTKVIIEDLSAREEEIVTQFLATYGKKRIPKKHTHVNVSMAEAHKTLMGILKPGKPLLNAIKVKDNTLELVHNFGEAEFESGVSVQKPKRDCPMPLWEKRELHGQSVLQEFLMPVQWSDFVRYWRFVVVGKDTGARYMLISRWNPLCEQLGVIYCITTNEKICSEVSVGSVPASEELLAVKIALECCEENFLQS